MKIVMSKIALAVMAAGLSLAAQANNCGTTKMYERGTNNNWTNQNPMTCNFWGQWQTSVNFPAPGSLKFELTGNSVWGEHYGDSNLADAFVNSPGNNIPVPQAGSTGVYFDYVKKTYKISHCNGSPLFLDAGGFPATPRSMLCGPDGRWSQDLLFGPSTLVNPDTSSPWPNALTSVKVISDTFQNIKTVTPPVSGRYRLAVASGTFAHELIAQDCGGLGLKVTYPNSTGHEQAVAMTCNSNTMTYAIDFDPAIAGGSSNTTRVRFIDGTNLTYGDNQLDGTLDAAGNLIEIQGRTRITVDLHTKKYQLRMLDFPCGTPSLSLLAPNATGKEQSNSMTCSSDGKWHYTFTSQNALFRLQDVNGVFWADNQPDGVLDMGGNLIQSNGSIEVIVDYPARTYVLRR